MYSYIILSSNSGHFVHIISITYFTYKIYTYFIYMHNLWISYPLRILHTHIYIYYTEQFPPYYVFSLFSPPSFYQSFLFPRQFQFCLNKVYYRYTFVSIKYRKYQGHKTYRHCLSGNKLIFLT